MTDNQVAGRRTHLLTDAVRETLGEISGRDVSNDALDQTFLEQGFDSLILTQVALAFSKRFGVPVKLRHLADEFPTCESIVGFLDAHVDQSRFQPSPSVVAVAPSVAPSPTRAPVVASTRQARAPAVFTPDQCDPVQALIEKQLAIMAQQLELLGGAGAADMPLRAPAPPAQAVSITSAIESPTEEAPANSSAEKPHRHGPQLIIRKEKKANLTAVQEKHLQDTIADYVRRTAASKAFTQRNRAVLADPRTASGFHPKMKEAVYPIVAKRSLGCRIWDLDGNEYIDLLSGYGSNFFGFGAPFVREAMARQLEEGMEIGPQCHLVEEVTRLFLEFVPSFDRIAYCNTGSEAVLATFRVARTVVGRDLIVMFEGGYHGMFDEVVVRSTPRRSMPAAPGIPRNAVENILVLPWNDPASLQIIRERRDEIAGVIVEPVQSRAPDVQPKVFLAELRALTTEIGAALIFDEVVCGFRVAPGGGQEYFGIEADLASYGKVVGGGISIGVVAGKRQFMDALDGGHWSYGDDSVPEVGVTYFAGTFVRHPLALAAARAVLLQLKSEGPALQRRINLATEAFAEELNAFFVSEKAPLKVKYFCSVMKIALTSDVELAELFFYHLRVEGVHIWEGRPCFLTTQHGAPELKFVVNAFKNAVHSMQKGGFFPASALIHAPEAALASTPPVPGARLGRDPDGHPAWFIDDPDRPGKFRKLSGIPREGAA